MGRPAFQRFLTSRHIPAGRAAAVTGVRWGGDFAAWDDLLAAGRDTAPQIRPGGAYAVDPAAGPSALAALFAVAVVPETVLLWASPAGLGITGRRIAPALHELPEGAVPFGAEQRPLWGCARPAAPARPRWPSATPTSGSRSPCTPRPRCTRTRSPRARRRRWRPVCRWGSPPRSSCACCPRCI
ncbi:hypothetical protein GCM10020256_30330 [Streptomyces thermocoprophilus]